MPASEQHHIIEATRERLAGYTDELVPEVIAEVAAIAAATHDLDADAVIADLYPVEIARWGSGHGREAVVLDIIPKVAYNERDALLLCIPVAATHTQYQQLRAALLARLFPDRRIIVIANTNGTDNGPRLSNDADRVLVARGHFGPLLDPVLERLHEEGVETVSAIGLSKGAELVSRLPALAHNHLIEVRSILAVEPPGVMEGNIGSLAIRLVRSGLQARPHIRAITSEAYRTLLQIETSFWRVARGVTALDTVAGAAGIARRGFQAWMDLGLRLHPDMRVTLAAGELSLLSPGHLVRGVVSALQERHGDRVKYISLGQHGHVVITDAALIGALAKQQLDNN